MKKSFGGTWKNFLSLTSSKSTTEEQEGGLGGKILNNVLDLIETNVPVYTSNKGTFINSTGLLNAYYGIVIYTIVADNETYVNKMIDESGYITYYLGNFAINKLEGTFINTHSINFNFIKYDYINLYGDFSQDVRQILEDILIKGVKIWYTENV